MATASQHDAVVVPVARDDDLDSAYRDGKAMSTISITDQIREDRQIYNRNYQNHKELDYCDFADQHPSAEVTGINLSDIMPSMVPPNLRFEIDDIELDWTFGSNIFDYVHIRYMMGCISDWPRLYQEAFNAMKPGGYIEHFDLTPTFESDDGTLIPGSALSRWGPLGIAASERMGKTFDIYPLTREALEKAGFVDIVEHNFKIPVGPWSSHKKLRLLGKWNWFFLTTDIEGIWLYLLTKFMGWSHEQVVDWVEEVTQAMKDWKTHVYYRANLFYGGKPEVKRATNNF